jgi:hypothetical protein
MFVRSSYLVTTAGVAFGLVTLLTTDAPAESVRFISSSGSNANPCTRDAPCRTLQRGVNRAGIGGELQILDAGAYGNATIDKSITITAVGVAATAGNLVVNAPGATIVLRGLLLNGINSPDAHGLRIFNAAAVHIHHCAFERFPGDGIVVDINNLPADIHIVDSQSRHNGDRGLLVTTSSEGVRLTVERSRFENNGDDGIRLVGGVMSLERSALVSNGAVGVFVAFGSILRISESVVTYNATGLENTSGMILSRVNNTVSGNTTNTSGTITALDPR